MKKKLTIILVAALGLLMMTAGAGWGSADPTKIIDQYAGDTSIYTLRAAEGTGES